MAHFPPPPEWSRELRTVGVTGTNGKTSTTRWIAAALRTLGLGPVVRVTTVGAFLDDEPSNVDETYGGFVAAMEAGRSAGGSLAAIEVTSEVLALGFVHAWPIEVAVFTNLSHDHLDAHRSAEHYLASKAQLFVHLPPNGTAVLNAFDPASALLREVVPQGARVITYGVPSRSDGVTAASVDVRAASVRVSWEGTAVELVPNAALALPPSILLRAIGEIFAENALAALGGAIAVGANATSAAAAIAGAPPPEGRFEVVARAPHVVVDYAHSPDALARTLWTARALTRGRLTVVFGAGGNRDTTKRAAMGEAARGADRVILTSDNPRDEDPRVIAAAIREGLAGHPAVDVVIDRAEAITLAIRDAAVEDVIVVAGKGHESTQTVAGTTKSMSDRDLARAAHALR